MFRVVMTLMPARSNSSHVLITLGIAAARGVGVGQLVHQGHRAADGEHGVEVHFLQHDAAILDAAARHLLQLADLRRGLGPAMRLDDADDHVDALPFEPLAFLQHLVGLADAGREAEIDLEPAALLFADQRQELLRRRPVSEAVVTARPQKNSPQRHRGTEKTKGGEGLPVSALSVLSYLISSLCLCVSVVSRSSFHTGNVR